MLPLGRSVKQALRCARRLLPLLPANHTAASDSLTRVGMESKQVMRPEYLKMWLDRNFNKEPLQALHQVRHGDLGTKHSKDVLIERIVSGLPLEQLPSVLGAVNVRALARELFGASKEQTKKVATPVVAERGHTALRCYPRAASTAEQQ